MSIDTSKIKIKEAKGKVKTFKAPEGKMYMIDEDGNAKLVGEGKSKTKRSIGPAGASTVSDDGTRMKTFAGGGLAEATAKLKAKGMKDGGMVVKEKIVAIDTSPNSGLITTKGFGASRRT